MGKRSVFQMKLDKVPISITREGGDTDSQINIQLILSPNLYQSFINDKERQKNEILVHCPIPVKSINNGEKVFKPPFVKAM